MAHLTAGAAFDGMPLNASCTVKCEPVACIQFPIDVVQDECKPAVTVLNNATVNQQQATAAARSEKKSAVCRKRSHVELNGSTSEDHSAPSDKANSTAVKREPDAVSSIPLLWATSNSAEVPECNPICPAVSNRNEQLNEVAGSPHAVSNENAGVHTEVAQNEEGIDNRMWWPACKRAAGTRPASASHGRRRRKRHFSSSPSDDDALSDQKNQKRATYARIRVHESDAEASHDNNDKDPEFCPSCTAVTVLADKDRDQISQLITAGVVSTLNDIIVCVGDACTREQARRIVSIYFNAVKFPEFDDDAGSILGCLPRGFKVIPSVTIKRVKLACKQLQKKHELTSQRNAGIEEARRNSKSTSSSGDDDCLLTAGSCRPIASSPRSKNSCRQRTVRWRPMPASVLADQLNLSVGLVCNIICHYFPKFAYLVQMPFESSICQACQIAGPNSIHPSITSVSINSNVDAAEISSCSAKKKRGPKPAAYKKVLLNFAEAYFTSFVGDESFKHIERDVPCTVQEFADHLQLDYRPAYSLAKQHFPLVVFTGTRVHGRQFNTELIQRADAYFIKLIGNDSFKSTETTVPCTLQEFADRLQLSYSSAYSMTKKHYPFITITAPRTHYGEEIVERAAVYFASLVGNDSFKDAETTVPCTVREFADNLELDYMPAYQLAKKHFPLVKFTNDFARRPQRCFDADTLKRAAELIQCEAIDQRKLLRKFAETNDPSKPRSSSFDELLGLFPSSSSSDASFDIHEEATASRGRKKKVTPRASKILHLSQPTSSDKKLHQSGHRPRSAITLSDLAVQLGMSYERVLRLRRRYFDHVKFIRYHNGSPCQRGRRPIAVQPISTTAVSYTIRHVAAATLLFNSMPSYLEELPDEYFVDGAAVAESEARRDLLQQIRDSVSKDGIDTESNEKSSNMNVYQLAAKLNLPVISTLAMQQRHFPHIHLRPSSNLPLPAFVPNKDVVLKQNLAASSATPPLSAEQIDAVSKILCEHAFVDGKAHCVHINSTSESGQTERCTKYHSDALLVAVPKKFAPISAELIARLVSAPVASVRHALETEFNWALVKGVACLSFSQINNKSVSAGNSSKKFVAENKSSGCLIKVRIKKPKFVPASSAAEAEEMFREHVRKEYVEKQNYIVPITSLATQFNLTLDHIREIMNDAEFFSFWHLEASSSPRLQSIAADMKPFVETVERLGLARKQSCRQLNALSPKRIRSIRTTGSSTADIVIKLKLQRMTVYRVAQLFYTGTVLGDEAAAVSGVKLDSTSDVAVADTVGLRKYRLRQQIGKILYSVRKRNRLHCLLPKKLAERVGITVKRLYMLLNEPFLSEQWLVTLWKRSLFEHFSFEVERLRIALERQTDTRCENSVDDCLTPTVALITQLAEQLGIGSARVSMYWHLFFLQNTVVTIASTGSSSSTPKSSSKVTFKLRPQFTDFPHKKLVDALQDEIRLFRESEVLNCAVVVAGRDSVDVCTVAQAELDRAKVALATTVEDDHAGEIIGEKISEEIVSQLLGEISEEIRAALKSDAADKGANSGSILRCQIDVAAEYVSTSSTANVDHNDDVVVASVATVISEASSDAVEHAADDEQQKDLPNNSQNDASVDKCADWHKQMCTKYNINYASLMRALRLIDDMHPEFVPASLMPSSQTLASLKKRFPSFEQSSSKLSALASSSMPSTETLPAEPEEKYADLLLHMRRILNTKLFMSNQVLTARLKFKLGEVGGDHAEWLVAVLRKKYMPFQLSLQCAATRELMTIIQASAPAMSNEELARLVVAAVNNVPASNAAAATVLPTKQEEKIFCKRLEQRIARMRWRQIAERGSADEQKTNPTVEQAVAAPAVPGGRKKRQRRKRQKNYTATAAEMMSAPPSANKAVNAMNIAVRRELSLPKNRPVVQVSGRSSVQKQLLDLRTRQTVAAFNNNAGGASASNADSVAQAKNPGLTALLQQPVPPGGTRIVFSTKTAVVTASTNALPRGRQGKILSTQQQPNTNTNGSSASQLRSVTASSVPNVAQQGPYMQPMQNQYLITSPQLHLQQPPTSSGGSGSTYRYQMPVQSVQCSGPQFCAGCTICAGVAQPPPAPPPPSYALPRNVQSRNHMMPIAAEPASFFPRPIQQSVVYYNAARAPQPRAAAVDYPAVNRATSPNVMMFGYQPFLPPQQLELQERQRNQSGLSAGQYFVYSSSRQPPHAQPPQYVRVPILRQQQQPTTFFQNVAMPAPPALSPPSQNGASYSQQQQQQPHQYQMSSAPVYNSNSGVNYTHASYFGAPRIPMPCSIVGNSSNSSAQDSQQYRSPPPGAISRDPDLRTQLQWMHASIADKPNISHEELAGVLNLPLERIRYLGTVYQRLVRMANERWMNEQQQQRQPHHGQYGNSGIASSSHQNVANFAHQQQQQQHASSGNDADSNEVEIIGGKIATQPAPTIMIPQQAVLIPNYGNLMQMSLVPVVAPAPACSKAPGTQTLVQTQRYAVLDAPSSSAQNSWWAPKIHLPPAAIAPRSMATSSALQSTAQYAVIATNMLTTSKISDAVSSANVPVARSDGSSITPAASSSDIVAAAPVSSNVSVDDDDSLDDDDDNDVINWLLG